MIRPPRKARGPCQKRPVQPAASRPWVVGLPKRSGSERRLVTALDQVSVQLPPTPATVLSELPTELLEPSAVSSKSASGPACSTPCSMSCSTSCSSIRRSSSAQCVPSWWRRLSRSVMTAHPASAATSSKPKCAIEPTGSGSGW
jgi:hypothetical protein